MDQKNEKIDWRLSKMMGTLNVNRRWIVSAADDSILGSRSASQLEKWELWWPCRKGT
jgi:hypothetical protein